ncbi:hypothetical protein M8998_10500 [Sphingobacterium sp. lm-10]|uniref:toxin-antitoxin system YwqK family antitoxin n=1 Tax=Sphingobacterium sp. lm-10 TaxID=2944904 RepID=UPI002022147E|nr:hypothetical protein [Sphingobacterium sp. lm-10]MCL7988368.1 hypothetical protein [Sphingobacterium sp. lm-10]
MKNTSTVILFISSLLISWYIPTASAQDSINTFFERINESEVRFFYDQNYFLVDKHCEFKSIERRAVFDRATNKFDGSFTDIGADGSLILTGVYKQGAKNGNFVAYHPNQQKKWEVTFRDNRPTGYWNYFYPDGKPYLSVSFTDSTTRIVSQWDRRGRLSVNQGNGKYEFRNPVDGFSEYGFSFYSMSGRIKDGLPNGTWNVYFENPEAKQSEFAAEEFYRNGVLVRGYNLFDDAEYSTPVHGILPYDSFYRAETLLFKQCNYDDFSGFSVYIAEYFRNAFQLVQVNNTVKTDFAFEVRVRKDGSPRDSKIIKSLPDEINDNFKKVIESIPFYVPSFNDGEYIDDTITVYGTMSSDADGTLQFQTNRIERKLEHK